MSELIKLKFAPITTYYETSAVFKDSKEQEFLIKISGYDKEKIESIIETWYIPAETPQNSLTESTVPNPTLLDNNLKLEQPSALEDSINITPTNEVDIVVTNISNRSLPYNFNYKLRREEVFQDLSDDVQIAYKINPDNPDIIFKETGATVTAIIKVTKDGATFTMLAATSKDAREQDWKPVSGPKFISVSNGRPGTDTLQYKVRDNRKFFKIKVAGKVGTSYEIDGSWDIN
ncbi:hypothetical protein H6G33_37620 [Calothrix sp. FACHB-1219]|uniref:hypothetical protein n=1 Tax=unclassified Calothrix TaxID=2619626 RepID=UPI001685F1C2|nr:MULTISPECIES: hypothetical protein [unclassified Calothrix]MBD2208101.1 hypothetical protein [Calothrix sp. FACHB-168]MBD2222648.1 hypothetical protein [Calothrix sp. FACHB-1219]